MPSPSAHSTTQLFLDVFDITNDMLISSDGAASVVISVSAMNFGLLSENEQDATIYAYAALLNSLSFPIQVVVRSQPKDVTAYLRHIQDQEQNTQNPIYKQKIREYRAFVESLVQEQHVLDKKFYIVIPLSALEMGLSTASLIPSSSTRKVTSSEKNYVIEKAKTNLYPRKDHLIDQLARIGLYSRQLNTQELIQMLYSSYNPESFEGQKVTDTSHYTTPLVQAKIQGDPTMADITMPTTPASAAVPPATNQPGSIGVTTPPDMGAQTPSVPQAPIMATPEPMSAAPMSSTVAETPIVTPPVMPAAPTMPTAPAAPSVQDPQELINKTLSELGSAPTPSMPAAPSTPAAAPTMPPMSNTTPGMTPPPAAGLGGTTPTIDN